MFNIFKKIKNYYNGYKSLINDYFNHKEYKQKLISLITELFKLKNYFNNSNSMYYIHRGINNIFIDYDYNKYPSNINKLTITYKILNNLPLNLKFLTCNTIKNNIVPNIIYLSCYLCDIHNLSRSLTFLLYSNKHKKINTENINHNYMKHTKLILFRILYNYYNNNYMYFITYDKYYNIYYKNFYILFNNILS